MNERSRVACDKCQERVFHEPLHIFCERPHHAEVDKGDDGSIAFRPFFDKNVAWMRVCVEEACFKKLVEVGAHGAFGHLQSVDSRHVESSIIMDLDAIDPLENQHTP